MGKMKEFLARLMEKLTIIWLISFNLPQFISGVLSTKQVYDDLQNTFTLLGL